MTILGNTYLPLRRFFRPKNGTFLQQVASGVPEDGKPTLNSGSFTKSTIDRDYARALVEYAAKFMRGPERRVQSADGDPLEGTERVTIGDLALNRALWDVLTAKIDKSSPQGLARQRIREVFKLFTEHNRKTLSYLQRMFGPDHLKDTHVIYNGHATGATVSLFPMLQAIGLTSGGVRRSNYSGDALAAPLINTILSELMRVKGRDFNLAAQGPEAIFEELRKPGTVILLNGGPMLATLKIPDDIRTRIEAGEVRFVLHNAADLEAFKKLDFKQAIALNLAQSLPKQLETTVIGYQLVQHAEEASEFHNRVKLQDSTVVVMGHGLIGQSITKGLLAQRVAQDKIVVVDTNTDPAADPHRVASERGLQVQFDLPNLCDHENVVVFVATNSVHGLDGSHLKRLGHNVIIINANSGGIGVDVDSIFGRKGPNGVREKFGPYRNARRFEHHRAFGIRPDEIPEFSDMVATRGPLDTPTIPDQVTIVNVAEHLVPDPQDPTKKIPKLKVFAPNLNDTLGQDQLDTSDMLATAAAIIKGITVPRKDPYEFPEDESHNIYLNSLKLKNDDCLM